MTFTFWFIFLLFIGVLVALDLGLLTRRPRPVTALEATASVALWILAAAAVGVGVAWVQSRDWFGIAGTHGVAVDETAAGAEFATVLMRYLAAYVTELSLSLDNIAVIALIFAHFHVKSDVRARLLFWTTLVCLLVRAGLIAIGGWLTEFEWSKYLFAALLVLAMLRLLITPDRRAELEQRRLIRAAERIPVGAASVGHKLLARVDGQLRGTPLLPVLLAAIATDVWLAMDSVPAAFAVVQDPLLALTANAMAILALRSIYFALQGALGRLRFVKLAVTVILAGLAVKVLVGDYGLAASIGTLVGVVSVMALGVVASLVLTRRSIDDASPRPTPLEDVADAVVITQRNLRKVIVLIIGTAVLLLAMALGPLPGPGFILLAPLGLAILATEFLWARRLMGQLKSQTQAIRHRADLIASRTPLWLVLLVAILFGFGTYLVAIRGPWDAWIVLVSSLGGWLAIGWWAWRAAGIVRQTSTRADSIRSSRLISRHDPASTKE
jgi:tellurite resistance protein TerC